MFFPLKPSLSPHAMHPTVPHACSVSGLGALWTLTQILKPPATLGAPGASTCLASFEARARLRGDEACPNPKF